MLPFLSLPGENTSCFVLHFILSDSVFHVGRWWRSVTEIGIILALLPFSLTCNAANRSWKINFRPAPQAISPCSEKVSNKVLSPRATVQWIMTCTSVAFTRIRANGVETASIRVRMWKKTWGRELLRSKTWKSSRKNIIFPHFLTISCLHLVPVWFPSLDSCVHSVAGTGGGEIFARFFVFVFSLI